MIECATIIADKLNNRRKAERQDRTMFKDEQAVIDFVNHTDGTHEPVAKFITVHCNLTTNSDRKFDFTLSLTSTPNPNKYPHNQYSKQDCCELWEAEMLYKLFQEKYQMQEIGIFLATEKHPAGFPFYKRSSWKEISEALNA